MNPRTSQLVPDLDASYAGLLAVAAAVPPALHTRRSEPDAWSASGVIHHLALVERRIAGVLSAKVDAVRAQSSPRAAGARAAATLDRARLVNRDRKIKTGEASQPRVDIDLASALAELAVAHADLRAALVSSDDFALDDVTHPHPVLGPLTFYQWIEFASAHEARHTEQIREILARETL